MSKKYELTGETVNYGKTILRRIKALKDFGDVKKGDLGGWIKSEENLSQEGLCWIYGVAKVFGNAKVYGDAKVYGNAEVYGRASVFGHAKVYGNAEVYDNSEVYGNAKVFGIAEVYGDTKVYGRASVFGHANVFGNAKVYDNAEVHERAKVYVDAEIKNPTDYIVIGPIGSRNDSTTFYKTKDSNIRVVCGCFNGTLEEFEKAVKMTHEGTYHEKAYMDAITFVKRTFS